MSRSSTTGLPQGRTFDELIRMARHVARTRPGVIIEWDEAVDIAACSLVERLYEDPPPTDRDLFQAAVKGLTIANGKQISYVGMDTKPSRSGRTGTPPGFGAYWYGRFSTEAPFEEALIERLAVGQVLGALPESHRDTLAALARHGSYRAARDAIGVSADRWQALIRAARRQARELWFSPEPAAPQWGTDRPRGPDARERQPRLERDARRRRQRRRAAADARKLVSA